MTKVYEHLQPIEKTIVDKAIDLYLAAGFEVMVIDEEDVMQEWVKDRDLIRQAIGHSGENSLRFRKGEERAVLIFTWGNGADCYSDGGAFGQEAAEIENNFMAFLTTKEAA